MWKATAAVAAMIAAFAMGSGQLCAQVAGGKALGAAPGVAAGDEHFAGQWRELRERLGAADYAQREAAQEELGRWPYAFYPALEERLKRETDPEIRVRLARGLDDIAVQYLIHQPPMSVDFDEATLEQVVKQLDGALGGPRIVPSWETRDKFTLHLKQVPFWEVVGKLNEQHPLVVTGNMGWGLTPTYNGMQGFTYNNIMATWATVNRVPGVPPPGMPATWNMAVTLAADPRVTMARCAGVRWMEIRDNAAANGGRGNDLLMGIEQQAASPLGSSTFRTNLTLKVPAAPGKKIRLMRGEAWVSIVTREETVEVADARQAANSPVRLPQGTVRVASLEKYGESMQLDLAFVRAQQEEVAVQNGVNLQLQGGGVLGGQVVQIQGVGNGQAFVIIAQVAQGNVVQVNGVQGQMQPQAEPAKVPALTVKEVPVTVQVVTEGKVVGTYVVASDLTVRFPASEKPVKLVVRYAAGVQEAKLPVELREVALP